MYLASGQEREKASAFPPLTPILINGKIPVQFAGRGQERGKQQYARPGFPLNTGACFSANTQPGILLQKTNPGQTCLIFHIPSNLSTSITGRSEIWWNKSDVCVYEGSPAEDV